MQTISNRNAWASLAAIGAQMHREEGTFTRAVCMTEMPAETLGFDARPNLTTDALFFGLGRELGLELKLAA